MSERELSEDFLSALLDGELDDDARVQVEARLASSAEWQTVLAEIAETRAALRGLGAVAAPDGFWDQVLANEDVVDDLAAHRATRQLPGASTKHRGRVAMLAGVAAAAAFVVGVAAVPSSPPDRVQPPVAAFSDAHATRSSVGDDAISTLAPVAVSSFGR